MSTGSVGSAVGLAMAFLLLLGCSGGREGERVLLDFETDTELDGLRWQCRVMCTLSDRYATHGAKSLRLELYPALYPGVAPLLTEHDWRGFEQLCFDVYNPHERTVRLEVRIDDRRDNPAYEDRYNGGVLLEQGMNSLCIPLASLTTSGTGRRLRLNDIRKLILFTPQPAEPLVLYLDYLRLVGSGGSGTPASFQKGTQSPHSRYTKKEAPRAG